VEGNRAAVRVDRRAAGLVQVLVGRVVARRHRVAVDVTDQVVVVVLHVVAEDVGGAGRAALVLPALGRDEVRAAEVVSDVSAEVADGRRQRAPRRAGGAGGKAGGRR